MSATASITTDAPTDKKKLEPNSQTQPHRTTGTKLTVIDAIKNKRVLLVGGAGTGKSTFANMLRSSTHKGATIVHCDAPTDSLMDHLHRQREVCAAIEDSKPIAARVDRFGGRAAVSLKRVRAISNAC